MNTKIFHKETQKGKTSSSYEWKVSFNYSLHSILSELQLRWGCNLCFFNFNWMEATTPKSTSTNLNRRLTIFPSSSLPPLFARFLIHWLNTQIYQFLPTQLAHPHLPFLSLFMFLVHSEYFLFFIFFYLLLSFCYFCILWWFSISDSCSVHSLKNNAFLFRYPALTK